MSGNAVPEVEVKVFRGDGFVRYSIETDRLYEAFTYSAVGHLARYAVDCTPVERLPEGPERVAIERASAALVGATNRKTLHNIAQELLRLTCDENIGPTPYTHIQNALVEVERAAQYPLGDDV